MTAAIAQRPNVIQRSAHDAGKREAAPQERRADNPCLGPERANHLVDDPNACVLASALAAVIALTPNTEVVRPEGCERTQS
jgi:hypothetical protein